MAIDRFYGAPRGLRPDPDVQVLDVHGPLADGHRVGDVVYESQFKVMLLHPIGEDGNGEVPVEIYLPGEAPYKVSISWHNEVARVIKTWGPHASVVAPAGAPVLCWVEVRPGTAPAA